MLSKAESRFSVRKEGTRRITTKPGFEVGVSIGGICDAKFADTSKVQISHRTS